MIFIGNHLSVSNGYLEMGKKESALGGNTFAFFTRNPRGGKAKPLDIKDMQALDQYIKEHEFGTLVAHAPYTMNLCSSKESVRAFAKEAMAEDLKRMEYLPGNYYNFHPGSHVGQGIGPAIEMIVEGLDQAMFEDMHTTVLLETMSGKGTEVGRNLSELADIISKVRYPQHLGVCFDTCHVWDGGYNIEQELDEILKTFDEVIGIDNLKAVHINDSMNICGSHKDRHAKIGEGEIGIAGLKKVVQHPWLQNKPFILETPNDDEGYAKEIAMIKEWMI
ncbi:deoxyribonuclease IV [Eubacterium oxidoreducens]|uniref:Probable endonuclease 4 n=1 Tax=Eubacterium oxidoreducens TaxID=1732 RepID=A0A1G6BHH1_EUBOX|nr:deoxyribonuclease IV [Eubacterium oxidoreducens]SDB20036.1 Endonuclease IV [Eubacterium oxidoreducens]